MRMSYADRYKDDGKPGPRIVRRFQVGFLSALIAFIVPEAAFHLDSGPSTDARGVLFVSLSVAIPALPLALIPIESRLIFFVLGLIAYGSEYVSDYGSGHANPLGIIS